MLENTRSVSRVSVASPEKESFHKLFVERKIDDAFPGFVLILSLNRKKYRIVKIRNYFAQIDTPSIKSSCESTHDLRGCTA